MNAKQKLSIRFMPEPQTYLLQSMVELHGPEEDALFTPQSGANRLTHHSQLAALWPDGVLSIVGIFNQLVAFTGQAQGTV